ncbi:MAG: hypothetical protein ABR581_11145 [Thermoleophilaceae bacterium]
MARVPARLGATALACAAALLLAAVPASAGTAHPLGFGIEAVGQPSYFVFQSKGGRAVRGFVRVRSTSDVPRTVHLRPADARTAATGGLEYGAEGAPVRQAGRWIRLERSRLRLPARGVVDIPFSVRVPRGSAVGDHLAGIVAYGRRPKPIRVGRSQFRLRFVSRLAIAVQVRVPGRLTRAVELRGAAIRVTPAGAALAVRLANTGNALIPELAGHVSVYQGGRRLFSRPLRVDALTPRTEIAYPLAWRGRPVQGDYSVRGSLRPQGGRRVALDDSFEFGKKRIKEYRHETGRPATASRGVSPAFMVLFLLCLIALAGLGAAHLRLRRRS